MVLGYQDGRKVAVGETLEMLSVTDCFGNKYVDPKPCKAGMHASEDVLDAIEYAPGSTLCRVAVWGDVKHEEDKLCGRFRHVLWAAKPSALRLATADIAQFALENVLANGGDVDPRNYAAVQHARDIAAGAQPDKLIIHAAAFAVDYAARSAARTLIEDRATECAKADGTFVEDYDPRGST
jgi:hypothetical protein